MGVRFTAHEALSMAQTIEANAVRFYQSAAASVSRDDCRILLAELARWERAHERTFEEMGASLSVAERESPVFDPDHEAAVYLKALADSKVIRAGEDPAARLGAKPTYRAILLAAIQVEEDSIAFYSGLRQLVPVALGQGRIDAVLAEERKHVVVLTQELAKAG